MKNTEGFTLLEVLLAIVLFASGVIALSWALSTGLYATVGVESMDLALNIAQANMEYIKSRTYDQIAADGDSGPAPDPNFGDYSITVNIAEGADPMQVDVTVTWNVKGGQDAVTLTTLVTDLN